MALTDLILDRPSVEPARREERRPPAVARVNTSSLGSIEAAVHPGLEVLSIGVWDVRRAPVAGQPRLRTLTADLANELLALRDRPPIIQTVIEGDLGPAA
ncbi:hypothetical protein ACM01_25940 [Streptomyces viridochromogenes]|uniref:Uncharacterized protein n=1 Tax=Streptomyces viridochromogenes TaxID=1938 RepID=A0A0J7Z8M9_STRVR|nr:hypothetical protein ACM01_25940 [Streptomyces viridochromogenes]KOG21139.1 hypothetical protein ADK36_15880 [Streptomyces viridochromogenes]KOG22669.1 hypothetical protein ADK35_15105 [Streptomyces viridochromogenes]